MQLNWWVGWGKKEVPPPPCPFAPQLVLTKKLSLGIFYELNQKVRQYSLQGVSSSSFKELFSEMSNAVPISFNLLVGLSHSIVGKKVAFFPFTKIFSRLFAGWFIHPSINYGHVECWVGMAENRPLPLATPSVPSSSVTALPAFYPIYLVYFCVSPLQR